MSIPKEARLWFEKKYGKQIEPIYSSKYYKPDESWPKTSVWWIHIPTNAIEKDSKSHINLLCQVGPAEDDFYYLKVPVTFLNQHLAKFYKVGNMVSLYFSTDPIKLFKEERGTGGLNFKSFLING